MRVILHKKMLKMPQIIILTKTSIFLQVYLVNLLSI